MPRKLCNRCQRPLKVCLCAHLVNLQAPFKVLILQHPSEQKQALATVPLLQLCLSPLQVLVAETFSDSEVIQALVKNKQNCRVLFPSENSQAWELGGAVVEPSLEEIETLIVLDGTWRKAKKMWHLNPWLHDFPCISLTNVPDSQYQIRSSSVAGGVSTLEAIAQACNYVSGSNEFNELNKPFNAMINMQIESMGEQVFKAHYLKE